jgi:hypothetical protein
MPRAGLHRPRACGCREPCPASDQRLRPRRLAVMVRIVCSKIARCGSPTRLPDVARAELAGASRPIRHRQERRDPRAPSPGSRAAHIPHPKSTWIDRAALSALSSCAGYGSSHRELCCAGTPISSPAAGPTPGDNLAAYPLRSLFGRWCCAWPGEPSVGLPTHPGRARRTRASCRRLRRL